MSCRPETIQCACGESVKVGKHGPLPWRCKACAIRHDNDRAMGRAVPTRASPTVAVEVDDAADLGPERPELGMTPQEYSEWRRRRVVELYEKEPELGVDAIAERVGLSASEVCRRLNEAGHQLAGSGRGSRRGFLAAGLPVP